jgi:putative DNA primase/helicase
MRTFAELLELAEQGELITPSDWQPGEESASAEENHASESPESFSEPLEADDDPHRLARVNLERYATCRQGATLRYWRDEWYQWKGKCYRKIASKELSAKITASIREEFKRVWREKMDKYESWVKSDSYDSDKDKGPPTVQKVTPHLVSSVVNATASMTIISSSIELGTMIGEPPSGYRYIAMQNGILDIQKLLAGEEDCMRPHTPDWFSTICLPYEFDPTATCPNWENFIHQSMEGDPERIALLQEWTGYCLLPTTDQQKFLMFEGEGSNGKSVYLAALEAMLGRDNCTHIGLEAFGKDFVLTQTIGKLVTIAPDCNDLDSVAEGYLKQFTSGDRMTFNRKNKDLIEATPTARLIVSTNVRPRFMDRSSGIWRRMILVPWRVVVSEEDKVLGMDEIEWWENSGELPGIFNWAIRGLFRLRRQRRLTQPRVCLDAMRDYQLEVNPTKLFFEENLIATDEGDYLKCGDLFEHYKQWAIDRNYRPVSDRTFGRELQRHFPSVQRKLRRSITNSQDRFYVYMGVNYRTPDDDDCENSNQLASSRAF